MMTKADNPTSSSPPPRRRSRGPDRLRRPRLFVVTVVFAATALVLSPAIVVVVDAFAFAGGRCHRPRRPFVAADDAPSFRSLGRGLTTATALRGFLDGIFGGGGDDDDAVEKIDGAVLATYDTAVDVDDDIDIDTRFESLSDYVTEKWIGLFEAGTISLTTPVKVSRTYDDENEDDDSEDSAVDDSAGCRLLFQKANTGYDDDENGNGKDPEKKKKKNDEPKQGGVEIVVRKLSKDGLLRVVARRCEIDEGTLVKEMSEEIILKELAKAIDVWKKEEAA